MYAFNKYLLKSYVAGASSGCCAAVGFHHCHGNWPCLQPLCSGETILQYSFFEKFHSLTGSSLGFRYFCTFSLHPSIVILHRKQSIFQLLDFPKFVANRFKIIYAGLPAFAFASIQSWVYFDAPTSISWNFTSNDESRVTLFHTSVPTEWKAYCSTQLLILRMINWLRKFVLKSQGIINPMKINCLSDDTIIKARST